MLQIFFKVTKTQRHRVAKFFSVTEFADVPNTRLRQAQSPEYLNPKNHAALIYVSLKISEHILAFARHSSNLLRAREILTLTAPSEIRSSS